MIPIIKSFRDKFFAHLDRESVYSHFRVDAGEAMKVVDLHELDTYISLIRELYTVCFGDLKMPKRQMPSQEHIIDTFFWRFWAIHNLHFSMLCCQNHLSEKSCLLTGQILYL